MTGEGTGRRHWGIPVTARPFGVLAALALIYALALVLGWGGGLSGAWLSSWAAAVAATSLFHAALRAPQTPAGKIDRDMWRWFGVAALAWCAGATVNAVSRLVISRAVVDRVAGRPVPPGRPDRDHGGLPRPRTPAAQRAPLAALPRRHLCLHLRPVRRRLGRDLRPALPHGGRGLGPVPHRAALPAARRRADLPAVPDGARRRTRRPPARRARLLRAARPHRRRRPVRRAPAQRGRRARHPATSSAWSACCSWPPCPG